MNPSAATLSPTCFIDTIDFYELLPFEEISKEEYLRRVKEMNPFVPSLIAKYEKEETEYDIGDEGCESGVCPIR
jgi:ribonucleoside-diphosphate reductase alpha chain/ribonucleoside-triphosphate reductase